MSKITKSRGLKSNKNEIRSASAEVALKHFSKITGLEKDESLGTVVTDLLADLLHLCKVRNVDFQSCLCTAKRHYCFEQSSEKYPRLSAADKLILVRLKRGGGCD